MTLTTATERAVAVDAKEAAYNSAGADRYVAWVRESHQGMRAELSLQSTAMAERAYAALVSGRLRAES